MSRFAYISAMTLSLVIAAPVLAQSTTSMAPDNGTGVAPTQQMPNLGATSSDSGNNSTGASSAAIGTGYTDKTGDNNPAVAAHSTTGSTSGANPNSPSATP